MRGHAGYTGFAWYRLRIVLHRDRSDRIALAGPTDVDSAHQLFWDGRLLGGSGDFTTQTPSARGVHPKMFMAPAGPALNGEHLVAFGCGWIRF